MAPGPERAPLELLEFLAPGLLHGLGNHLFAIHGRVQLLRDDGHERGALLKASEKALQALEVLRFVLGEAGGAAPAQADILLHRLCDYVRLPLREHGLKVELAHSSTEVPLRVDGTALCRSLLELLRHLVLLLPSGYEGTVGIDVAAQRKDGVIVKVRIEHAPTQLPFPLDLNGAVARSRPVLDGQGVALEPVAGRTEVWLRLPVAMA